MLISYLGVNKDTSCWLSGNWRVSYGRCYKGNKGGSQCECRSDFSLCSIRYSFNWSARLKNPHFSPGPESSECQLFTLNEIPFSSLSFSSMVVTLSLYVDDMKAGGKAKFHYGTINKRPGTSASDIHAYTLHHHMQS